MFFARKYRMTQVYDMINMKALHLVKCVNPFKDFETEINNKLTE
jgi:hypothetical protein